MSVLSTIVLTVNMIVNQFCGDFNIEKCDVKVGIVAPEELPWVNDPKGARKAQGLQYGDSILLNKSHWSLINKWEKKELVYHELGHLFLKLDHNSDISIMNPFPKTRHYHVKEDGSNWKSLVSELKNREKGSK